MGNKGINRFLAIFVVFMMFLSLLSPMNAAANELNSNNSDESLLLANQAILEQLLLRQGEPKLHDDLKGLSGNQRVEVIIHLSENPVALEQGIAELNGETFSMADAAVAKEAVLTQQEAVVREMAGENISFAQNHTFDTVLNGFSAEVRASDLSKLLQIEGITLVEPDVEVHTAEVYPEVQPDSLLQPNGQVEAYMNVTNDFLGINRLWEKGYEGQGIKVAVLDTGIDVNHPDLQPIYKGGKNFIPHNPSLYKGPRADNDGSETKPEERPANVAVQNERGSLYATSHGTHVAGTIAAIGANELGVKGIAPKVDLYSYRVLGAYGSGSTSGIVAAIEYAVYENMDIINLSLGGGSNTEVDASSYAINNAMLAGVISVIATGNSGPNRGTMGTPSTAPLGIAVGNSTKPELQTDVSVGITVGNEVKSEKLTLITLTDNVTEQLTGKFDLVNIPGFGRSGDFDGEDVAGKIALIARGEINFTEKVANAKAKGAKGVLIYNNAPGLPTSVYQGTSPSFIPGFGMSQALGLELASKLESNQSVKVSFNIHTYLSYDKMNDSSSRGPSVPNFDIKPDVVAPGTNILSAVPTYDLINGAVLTPEQAYGQKTGTSMATPHIAGIAALIKQANPTWTPFDIKVALSNTAKVLDGYDVFDQGAGRVNAYDAAFPSALAYVQDEALRDNQTNEIVPNIKGTVTFGPQPIKEQNILVQRQVVVKDMKGLGGRYQVTVDMLKGFGDASVTVDKPSIILAPNGQETITITLQASQNPGAQFGDEMFGYIYITPTEPALTTSSLLVNQATINVTQGEAVQLNVFEKTTQTHGYYTGISLPFAADFSVVTNIKGFSISSNDLSFATTGDTATVSFELTRPVDYAYVYLRNLQDLNAPAPAPIASGAIGYMRVLEDLAATTHTIPVGPNYRNWQGLEAQIPEGVYSVDFIGAATSGGLVRAWTGDAVVVKRSTPIVAATVTSSDTGSVVLSGQVSDKYIDFNNTLKNYGLDYKLNDKLKAEYAVNDGAPVAFPLNENGSFNLGIQGVSTTADTVKVIVTDAAGNKGEGPALEVTTFEVPTRESEINAADFTLSKANAKYIQASLTPFMTKASTNEFITNVTREATYSVANNNIVEVRDGIVYGKSIGSTTITVKYGYSEVVIPVTVRENYYDGGFIGGGAIPGIQQPETQPEAGQPEAETDTSEEETSQSEEQEKPAPFVPVDLPANHWAAGYIQQMIERGLLRGNENGEVKPNANVTRAQFASILARA
ncbi:S8 family serine peptidase, partial [Metasolibacillus meyeri]|uniref:S8 family serine peptidase n=1 Tax=Metasolibacillus meyeri TaxID=1071052 RepID=UPI000D2FA9FA